MNQKQKRVANTVLIVLVVIVTGTVRYLAFNQNDTATTPVPSPAPPTTTPSSTPTPSPTPAPAPKNNTVSVSLGLGQQFTLNKSQIAKIVDTGLEIEITEFFNSPCPPEVQCFWSGVGIDFEYRFKGQVQKHFITQGTNLVQAFGYQTILVKTDYETYANLVVEKMK